MSKPNRISLAMIIVLLAVLVLSVPDVEAFSYKGFRFPGFGNRPAQRGGSAIANRPPAFGPFPGGGFVNPNFAGFGGFPG